MAGGIRPLGFRTIEEQYLIIFHGLLSSQVMSPERLSYSQVGRRMWGAVGLSVAQFQRLEELLPESRDQNQALTVV